MNIALLDYDNTLSDGYTRYKLGYAMEEAGLIKRGLKEQIEDLENRYLNGEIDYNTKFQEDKLIFADYNDGLKRTDAARFLENDFDLKSSIYPWTTDFLRRLNDEGYLAVVISGAWDYIMEHAQAILDFDSFFATEIEENKGKFTMKYKTIMDYKTKETITKQVLMGCDNSIGLGDSIADFSFLDQVDKAILYNPKDDAKEAAKGKGFILSNEKSILDDLDMVLTELEG